MLGGKPKGEARDRSRPHRFHHTWAESRVLCCSSVCTPHPSLSLANDPTFQHTIREPEDTRSWLPFARRYPIAAHVFDETQVTWVLGISSAQRSLAYAVVHTTSHQFPSETAPAPSSWWRISVSSSLPRRSQFETGSTPPYTPPPPFLPL